MSNRRIILPLFVAKLSWAWSNCTIISPTTTNYYVETPAWMYPLSYSPCETCLAYIITDVHQPITSHTVEHGATTRYIAPYWDWNFHRTRTVTVVEDAPQTPRSQIQTWFAKGPQKSASPVEGGNGLAYNYCFEYIITYVVRELNDGLDYLRTVTITTTVTSIFTEPFAQPQTISELPVEVSLPVHTSEVGDEVSKAGSLGPGPGHAPITPAGSSLKLPTSEVGAQISQGGGYEPGSEQGILTQASNLASLSRFSSFDAPGMGNTASTASGQYSDNSFVMPGSITIAQIISTQTRSGASSNTAPALGENGSLATNSYSSAASFSIGTLSSPSLTPGKPAPTSTESNAVEATANSLASQPEFEMTSNAGPGTPSSNSLVASASTASTSAITGPFSSGGFTGASSSNGFTLGSVATGVDSVASTTTPIAGALGSHATSYTTPVMASSGPPVTSAAAKSGSATASSSSLSGLSAPYSASPPPNTPTSASYASGTAALATVPVVSPSVSSSDQVFQLYVANNIPGLDQLAVGESGDGRLIVGGVVEATVLQINNASNMTDLDGNYIYFIPKGLRKRQDDDPTLQYSSDPPANAVTSGFSLQNITLASNSTEGNYTFYTCNTSPNAQPIYVAEVGQTPGVCFSFDLVTTPPPLNDTNSTISSAQPGTTAATLESLASVSSNSALTGSLSDLPVLTSSDYSSDLGTTSPPLNSIDSMASSALSTTAAISDNLSSLSSDSAMTTSTSGLLITESTDSSLVGSSGEAAGSPSATAITTDTLTNSDKSASFNSAATTSNPLSDFTRSDTATIASDTFPTSPSLGIDGTGPSNGEAVISTNSQFTVPPSDTATMVSDTSSTSPSLGAAAATSSSGVAATPTNDQSIAQSSDTAAIKPDTFLISPSLGFNRATSSNGAAATTADSHPTVPSSDTASSPASGSAAGTSPNSQLIVQTMDTLSSLSSNEAGTISDSSVQISSDDLIGITSSDLLAATSSSAEITNAINPISTSASTAPSNTVLASIVQTEGDYVNQGLYYDSSSDRILSAETSSKSSMSVSVCATFCLTYKYFGVENGDTCYCGFSLDHQPVPASDQSGNSNLPCSGNDTEFCGGPSLIQLYSLSNAPVTSAGITLASESALAESSGSQILSPSEGTIAKESSIDPGAAQSPSTVGQTLSLATLPSTSSPEAAGIPSAVRSSDSAQVVQPSSTGGQISSYADQASTSATVQISPPVAASITAQSPDSAAATQSLSIGGQTSSSADQDSGSAAAQSSSPATPSIISSSNVAESSSAELQSSSLAAAISTSFTEGDSPSMLTQTPSSAVASTSLSSIITPAAPSSSLEDISPSSSDVNSSSYSNEASSSSPDQTSSSTPEQTSSPSPKQASSSTPEQTSSLSAEQTSSSSPDQTSSSSPERASTSSPEQTSSSNPEQASSSFLEQSALSFSGQTSSSFPEQASSSSLDQIPSSSSIEHTITSVTSSSILAIASTSASAASAASSLTIDPVAAATSIIESQGLQPFCSQLLGYTTPVSRTTTTITQSTTTTTTAASLISAIRTSDVVQTQFTTVPSTTTQPLVTTTTTVYSIVAYTVTGKKKKRGLNARQATASASSTPSALATFSPEVLSSACSKEATPVTQTSTITQSQTTTQGFTTTTTSLSTTIAATVFRTTITTQTVTSGVSTKPVSTITSTSTIISTTTITVASGAPTAPPNYLAVSPDPNTGANWALSDPSTHLTDNYLFPNRREVFALTGVGQLYSVTNNSWYGVVAGTAGTTNGKIFWDTRKVYGNTTWYGTALNDGTGRTQLFLNNTATSSPYNFCVANIASGDSNPNTGFHLYYYTTTTVNLNCIKTFLYLSPVSNG